MLNKPSALTSAEFETMKKHASMGARILTAVDFPYPIVPIVRHHHERWDGGGYPDGLVGAEIPLGARILAVVDCFDALTSDRPYRPRLTDEQAAEILRSRQATFYDPVVVEKFVELIPELRRADAACVERRGYSGISRRGPGTHADAQSPQGEIGRHDASSVGCAGPHRRAHRAPGRRRRVPVRGQCASRRTDRRSRDTAYPARGRRPAYTGWVRRVGLGGRESQHDPPCGAGLDVGELANVYTLKIVCGDAGIRGRRSCSASSPCMLQTHRYQMRRSTGVGLLAQEVGLLIARGAVPVAHSHFRPAARLPFAAVS